MSNLPNKKDFKIRVYVEMTYDGKSILDDHLLLNECHNVRDTAEVSWAMQKTMRMIEDDLRMNIIQCEDIPPTVF